MPATGYIQVNAYASYARLPLRDVAITITANDGTAIAMRGPKVRRLVWCPPWAHCMPDTHHLLNAQLPKTTSRW